MGKLGTVDESVGYRMTLVASGSRHMPMTMDELPPEERIARYREMAEHTRSIGLKVQNPNLREAYMELSGRWRALADSTQRSFAPKNDR